MKLQIETTDTFRDGGTLMIKTNQGTYFVDGQGGPTNGMLFSTYPDGADPIEKEEARGIKKKLISSLKNRSDIPLCRANTIKLIII